MTAPDRILVVDDTPNNVVLLEDMLTARGYEVATARDGVEALEKVASHAPDLVLLDLMMPRMNGYEVLEHLRADAVLRHIPVIMISAVDEMESVVRCIELGADDYLPKPFNPTLLRARVSASLEKKSLRDEIRASLARLERELDAARALQLGMLPTAFPVSTPECPVRVHALMAPALEVGGDLYDFFYPAPGIFCFLVGDVSGKGAPAAMFMARTRSLIRMAVTLWQNLAPDAMSPAIVAETVNRELCQDNRERMFVTLFLGFLDMRKGALEYINAGHPWPNVLHASGCAEKLQGKPQQPPLGVRREMAYQTHSLDLRAGDGMFIFSDGVVEARNGDDEAYGDARLACDLQELASASPLELTTSLKHRVDTFAGGAPQTDDVTMLAYRWDGCYDRSASG